MIEDGGGGGGGGAQLGFVLIIGNEAGVEGAIRERLSRSSQCIDSSLLAESDSRDCRLLKAVHIGIG